MYYTNAKNLSDFNKMFTLSTFENRLLLKKFVLQNNVKTVNLIQQKI
jgi:hypothetical protein